MITGELRHVITVEQNTPAQDSSGAVTNSWSTFATIRAKREALSGREFLEARAIIPETMFRFTMWKLAGMTEAMRLRDEDDAVYDIKAILPSNDNRVSIVMAARTDTEAA